MREQGARQLQRLRAVARRQGGGKRSGAGGGEAQSEPRGEEQTVTQLE
jgi:hypothetical protein